MRKVFFPIGALCVAAACLAAISCSKAAPKAEALPSAPSVAPSAAANGGAIAEAPRQDNVPDVGDAKAIPAIKLEGEDFFLAYRHTGHAYLDTYGFDTEIFRFRKNANGTLKGASLSKLMMDGETTIDGLVFSHVNDEVSLRSTFQGKGEGDCLLKPEGGALVARGKGFTYSYLSPEGGGLRIERRRGDSVYTEEWSRDGASMVTYTANPGAKGHFEGDWPRPRLYIERPDNDPSGSTDTQFEFFEVEGGVKFRSDSVAPLGEAFLMGFESAFPQGLGLEALALLDLSLGEDRRITPLLARLYIGRR